MTKHTRLGPTCGRDRLTPLEEQKQEVFKEILRHSSPCSAKVDPSGSRAGSAAPTRVTRPRILGRRSGPGASWFVTMVRLSQGFSPKILVVPQVLRGPKTPKKAVRLFSGCC